ncbi:hypothetical protein TrST_g99 [Triparma strigata]|uniref:Major facilitator superfamily (MFS) profile domain-containing protein n=1 Tax=Triparma strigata TaxID=1606541 RepID=A0A9W7A9W4_9STRA|nr:hypothetical protein TrST_g99 [Triparma strigata]
MCKRFCSRALFSNPVFRKLEAWGYLLILSIRGTGFSTSIFMNIALLQFGYASVGCTGTGKEIGFNVTSGVHWTSEEAEEIGQDCAGEMKGMNLPIVTGYLVLNSFSTVISTCSAPVFGSFVDSSPNRKIYTIATCAIYILINFFHAFSTQENWLLMVLLGLFVQRIAYSFNVACIDGYCIEIAENEEEVMTLQSIGRVVELSSMLLFLFFVGVLGFLVGNDIAVTARMGNIIFTCLALPLLYLSHKRLAPRPALRSISGGDSDSNYYSSRFFDTFSNLYKTLKDLKSSNRVLLQYLVGVSFIDSASGSIISLLPVYAMQQLNIPNPSSLVGLTMVCSIPGALLAKFLAEKRGTRFTLFTFVAGIMFGTSLLSALVYSDDAVGGIIALCLLFGVTLGGIYPMQKSLYMTIIPAGQEVEYQGLYSFFSQVADFLPGLWFGFAVDSKLGGEKNSRRVGMLAPVFFHLVGILLCCVFLDEEGAKRKAEETRHKRVRVGEKARMVMPLGEEGLLVEEGL